MNCPKCNSEILEEVKYCPNCGYHYPSLTRDKSTFAVEVIRKIFKKKYKETPVSNESTEKEIVVKKERKWGWGWYILLGIIYTSINNVYGYLGNSKSILTLLGAAISIIIYFYLRNKALTQISSLETRSFLSGIISYIITAMVVSGVAVLIKPNIINDSNVTNILESELKQMEEYIYGFASKDKLLWGRFNDSPSTPEEINTNISLLNDLILLYKEKDSVLISSYNDILVAMEFSQKWKVGVPDLLHDFHSIVDISPLIAIENQKYLNTLLNYYTSLKKKDNQENIYWTNYEKSFNEAQRLMEKLNPVLKRITGKDFNKLWEEIEKKYYNK